MTWSRCWDSGDAVMRPEESKGDCKPPKKLTGYGTYTSKHEGLGAQNAIIVPTLIRQKATRPDAMLCLGNDSS